MPPVVSTAYTYDTASNRTGAFDARPKSSQPLSNMYAYDGLHRLVDARRGAWTGGLSSPSVSQLKGSQQWALDPLGNWSSVGTDLDGAGGIDSDETETRDHRDPSLTPPTNRVNELYARELAPDTGGGTVDLSYDFAGNLLRQQLQSGGALRYTHDAWNRLVKVEFEDAEEDLHPRAEYEYNPLNWRTVERTDTDTTDSTHALDEMRVHLYDASWRLLESRIDSDFDPEETSPDFEEHAQLVWGLRYIDDIVSTRRDLNPSEEDGAEVRMFHATDAQFSSVAVLLNNGSLLERVAYSPYGVARHQWPADASGDGAVNSADLSIVLSSYGSITSSTYRSEADFNRDGSVDAADLAAVLSYAAALPEGTLSSPAIANRTGYCGYRFAPETEMYLARNRWNSPPLGRWIERDPLGYVDGMNLYEYVGGGAVSSLDPWGLSTATGDQWWKDRDRLICTCYELNAAALAAWRALAAQDKSDVSVFVKTQSCILNALDRCVDCEADEEWLRNVVRDFMTPFTRSLEERGSGARIANLGWRRFFSRLDAGEISSTTLGINDGRALDVVYRCIVLIHTGVDFKTFLREETVMSLEIARQMALNHIRSDLDSALRKNGIGNDKVWRCIGDAVKRCERDLLQGAPDLEWLGAAAARMSEEYDVQKLRDSMRERVRRFLFPQSLDKRRGLPRGTIAIPIFRGF